MSEYKGSRTLSKCKYAKFVEELRLKLENEEILDIVTATLRDVLKFDPDVNTYDEVKEKLEKTKEEGISSYKALPFHKKYYEKNKEKLNSKRRELYKEKKLLKDNLV